MKQMIWLALAYQAPIEPSKNRVYIWRKLKEYGACYLKQGVALLPKSNSNLARFRALSSKIFEMGGDAVITEMRFIDPADERNMVEQFYAQSQKEYSALMEELQTFQIEHAQAVLDSDDAYDNLRKIVRKFGKAYSRDYFRTRKEVSRAFHDLLADMANSADFGRFVAEIIDYMED